MSNRSPRVIELGSRDRIHVHLSLRLEFACCPLLAVSTDGTVRKHHTLTLHCSNPHSTKPSPTSKEVGIPPGYVAVV